MAASVTELFISEPKQLWPFYYKYYSHAQTSVQELCNAYSTFGQAVYVFIHQYLQTVSNIGFHLRLNTPAPPPPPPVFPPSSPPNTIIIVITITAKWSPQNILFLSTRTCSSYSTSTMYLLRYIF